MTKFCDSGEMDIGLFTCTYPPGASQGALSDKEHTSQCRRHKRVLSLVGEDPLEEGMATHSSILAWEMH